MRILHSVFRFEQMFTGIIESAGTIKEIDQSTFTFRHTFGDTLTIGESIAVNGMCVTVTKKSADFFSADIMEESRNRTVFSHLKTGDIINMERSAIIGQRNSGHQVSGHVDETGKIVSITEKSDFWLIRISFSPENFPLVIFKGSITVDGISLTVSQLSADKNNPWFEISIIPHTWKETNLHQKKVGDLVDLEFDQYGKYILRAHNSERV